ncbi:2-hydroxyacid dehydrogenase [Mameliella alba]|uniref:2-hydroxyacid dehydrogenase n=1 Tax=Mameliella alba TaxID=561184 RepID=UPI000B534A04|nr:2-hydroxyacid dehydrogenase [Mameliella alba]MBY6122426.1 2-hydroxyacid dehydrogenase [Mameliella alba]OWV39643.1 dihydrofolate reductase [Mameliella alba]OWV53393.1 dihydrofolate reductase [Mameliella alba]
MSKEDVLVLYPARPRAMEQLEAAYTLHRLDEAEDKAGFLAEHGPRCRGIVTNGHAALTRADLEHLPNLEIVCCSSAGFESIDDAALREKGIALTNSSDALCDDVADTAVMLTLACRRDLVAAHDYVKSGDWGRKGMYPLLSALKGKKVGIAGLGTIGKAIASRLTAFRVCLGYHSRRPKPVDHAYFETVTELARWADILIVIVPGGPETEGMINTEVLEALGPQGTLINVARGSVVNEADLIAALTSGTLGNAGLDVYLNEPNPDPALTALPNVTLYPHHASGTVETRDAMAQTVVDNLRAHFAGEPLLNPVYTLPESVA